MSKGSKNKEEAILFEPANREMKIDYPELADVEEFKELKNNEMKFVWYYASSSSPIRDLNDRVRAEKALSLSYGKFAGRDNLKRFKEGDFPTYIKKAIAVMKSYRVDYRLRGKLAQEYIFDKMLEVVQVEIPINSMDFDERKKYTDVALKVSSSMPELLKNLEYGCGVNMKEIKEKRKKSEVKANITDILEDLD